MTHDGGWTFIQNFSSPALTVWDRYCLEDSERKDVNETGKPSQRQTFPVVNRPYLKNPVNYWSLIFGPIIEFVKPFGLRKYYTIFQILSKFHGTSFHHIGVVGSSQNSVCIKPSSAKPHLTPSSATAIVQGRASVTQSPPGLFSQLYLKYVQCSAG